MRHAIIVVWLSIISLIQGGAAQSRPQAVPFTTNSDGMVILPATFGDGVEGHVIFDTGGGLDVFAPSLVQRLGGKPQGVFTGFRMNGERMDLALYSMPSIEVGAMRWTDSGVGVWKALDGFPDFQGIITLNDFRHQPFTIDFAHHVFVFETAESLARRVAQGTVIPLHFDDYRGIALDSFASFRLGSRTGLCEIDTGSPESTISTRLMSPFGLTPASPGVHKRVKRNMAGVEVTNYDATIPALALQSAPAVQQTRPRVSFSDIIYDCVAGVDFWHGRAVTYDIPRRELIVSRPETANSTDRKPPKP